MLRLCLGFIVCCSLASCASPPAAPEVALVALASGLTLQMERVSSHPIQAEYNRTIRLISNGKTVASAPVAMDTGGYIGAKVYQMSPNQIVVDDLFDTYLVDKKRLTIIQEDVNQAKRGVYLGKFDEDANQNWAFIAAPK